jgi:D-glycero-D-manno-heptose 1,7-bisphosphate phosphatase
MNHKLAPALCLDLDGTVRRSKSGETFIKNYEDIEIMPGIERIVRRYRELGWLICGITNQGGVAFGYKKPSEVMHEVDETARLMRKAAGVDIFHVIKACYQHPEGSVEPYCHRSLLRKPDIGMLALIEVELFGVGYVIDWDKSLFVGDRPEDLECAQRAGIRFRGIDDFLTQPHIFEIGESSPLLS